MVIKWRRFSCAWTTAGCELNVAKASLAVGEAMKEGKEEWLDGLIEFIWKGRVYHIITRFQWTENKISLNLQMKVVALRGIMWLLSP